jgi:hypothetical protein
MVTLCLMRPLGDFLRKRLAKCYRSVEAFAKVSGVSKPTLYGMFTLESAEEIVPSDVERSAHNEGTLEAVAEHLHFSEWGELIEAWRADDLYRGIAFVVRVERREYDLLVARAKDEKLTVPQLLLGLALKKETPRAEARGAKG